MTHAHHVLQAPAPGNVVGVEPSANQPTAEPAPPRAPPTDPAEEPARLRADAVARGVEPDAAVDLAHTFEHTLPAADALRAVDRRIVSGLTVDEARRILVDEDSTPPQELRHEHDEGS